MTFGFCLGRQATVGGQATVGIHTMSPAHGSLREAQRRGKPLDPQVRPYQLPAASGDCVQTDEIRVFEHRKARRLQHGDRTRTTEDHGERKYGATREALSNSAFSRTPMPRQIGDPAGEAGPFLCGPLWSSFCLCVEKRCLGPERPGSPASKANTPRHSGPRSQVKCVNPFGTRTGGLPRRRASRNDDWGNDDWGDDNRGNLSQGCPPIPPPETETAAR
jgi:hypothetical protein